MAAGVARADVYMHYPPGSNNRLDEGGGNRQNNNRLMDTQNNAKGGYGYGGDSDNQAPPVRYMAGSKLSMAWTSQHSCGSENAECQIVIQYMCNDGQTTPPGLPQATAGVGEGPVRDGTSRTSPDPNDPTLARGLHEPTSFYQACADRERNKGLYIADQNLNGNGRDEATHTRQNPNGQRSGLECAEERDYYPYWAPTPWKDLMIMTNNLALCDFYQSNSQNVAKRVRAWLNRTAAPTLTPNPHPHPHRIITFTLPCRATAPGRRAWITLPTTRRGARRTEGRGRRCLPSASPRPPASPPPSSATTTSETSALAWRPWPT